MLIGESAQYLAVSNTVTGPLRGEEGREGPSCGPVARHQPSSHSVSRWSSAVTCGTHGWGHPLLYHPPDEGQAGLLAHGGLPGRGGQVGRVLPDGLHDGHGPLQDLGVSLPPPAPGQRLSAGLLEGPATQTDISRQDRQVLRVPGQAGGALGKNC